MTRRCNDIGKDKFQYKILPGELFINIFYQDYLPHVLKDIYNDPVIPENKQKSKKVEKCEQMKITK